ncbi:beta/gamma crystallin-related protein [Pseudoduganella sp. GCM10020061]|uniref:beta/gamma crystallin-related protein n=1 Tax=Pseudoduganella sp. GCM10020061 TaxID=3317345 RepID=UPI0036269A11
MFPRSLKAVLVAALCLPAVQAAAAEITLYEHDNFNGRELTLREATPDLNRFNFNDRTSSIIVRSGAWEVCMDAGFRGGCRVFEPGQYRRMDGMNDRISSVRRVGRDRDDGPRGGRRDRDSVLQLYATTDLRGRGESVGRDTPDFTYIGFNDRTYGIRVLRGTWELCSDANFRGVCRTYGPGVHNDLGRGLAGRVSSARRVDRFDRNDRYGDEPAYGGPGAGSGRPAVELFTGAGFSGSAIALNRDVHSMSEFGFNDRASSIVISEGEWQFCEHEGMGGQCLVLGPGRYDRLGDLDRAITSVRRLR